MAYQETTKEDLKLLLETWPKYNNIQEIALSVGHNVSWVRHKSMLLKKAGFPIKSKRVSGNVKAMIEELKAEMGV